MFNYLFKQIVDDALVKEKNCRGCKHIEHYSNGEPFCNIDRYSNCVATNFSFKEIEDPKQLDEVLK